MEKIYYVLLGVEDIYTGYLYKDVVLDINKNPVYEWVEKIFDCQEDAEDYLDAKYQEYALVL